VTFYRPNLGLHEVNGTRDNNVILTCEEYMDTHKFDPFLDPRLACANDQRFKAVGRN
jgi:hypothetical protein